MHYPLLTVSIVFGNLGLAHDINMHTLILCCHAKCFSNWIQDKKKK